MLSIFDLTPELITKVLLDDPRWQEDEFNTAFLVSALFNPSEDGFVEESEGFQNLKSLLSSLKLKDFPELS
jgi:hypothetical protein